MNTHDNLISTPSQQSYHIYNIILNYLRIAWPINNAFQRWTICYTILYRAFCGRAAFYRGEFHLVKYLENVAEKIPALEKISHCE